MFRRRAKTVSENHEMSLPSLDPGLYFHGQFRAVYTPLVPARKQQHPDHVVWEEVCRRVAEICSSMPVTALSAAYHQANAALGRLGICQGGEVRIHRAAVTLSVSAETARQVTDEQRELRSQETANRLQQLELARLARFRATVLSDPAAAMSYWFMQHPQTLDPGDYDKITHLINTINDHDPAQRWNQVARILATFVEDLSHDGKALLLQKLVEALNGFDRRHEAQTVEALFPEYRERLEPPVA